MYVRAPIVLVSYQIITSYEAACNGVYIYSVCVSINGDSGEGKGSRQLVSRSECVCADHPPLSSPCFSTSIKTFHFLSTTRNTILVQSEHDPRKAESDRIWKEKNEHSLAHPSDVCQRRHYIQMVGVPSSRFYEHFFPSLMNRDSLAKTKQKGDEMRVRIY